jgi:hypothetical protein
MRPRGLIIDLRGLPAPRATLEDVRLMVPPERVLVVTALGTLSAAEVRGLGFNVIERPATIGQVVAGAGTLFSNPLQP